jgi:hypothetical protein
MAETAMPQYSLVKDQSRRPDLSRSKQLPHLLVPIVPASANPRNKPLRLMRIEENFFAGHCANGRDPPMTKSNRVPNTPPVSFSFPEQFALLRKVPAPNGSELFLCAPVRHNRERCSATGR